MSSAKNMLQILIIGAGIGGLTTAIALRQAGHIVTVLEQSLMKKEVGAALTIPPNATRVLLSLGLDLQKAMTVPYDRNRILLFDESSTKELSQLDVKAVADQYGSPCVSSHRVDLHEALMALALSENGPGLPVNLILGARALAFDPVAGSVTVEDGTVYSADLMIGADGLHSKARRFVAGFDSPPRPSTTTVMRFTVASDTIRNDPVMAPLLEGEENTLRCYLTQAVDTRYLLQYPCRNNILQNFVAYDTNDTENLVDEGSTRVLDRKFLLHRLRGFNAAITSLCQVADEVLPLWKCLDREPLPKLYEGRLLLIGDAAHPMYPHLGQGAAMAIEDGGVLGALLDNCNPSQISNRLEIFQHLRHSRVSACQIMARVKVTTRSLDEVEGLCQEYFPEGPCPKTRLEVSQFLYGYDFFRAASEALEKEQ